VNGGSNEEWQIYDQGNGYVAIVNAYSRLVLADPGDPTSDGTPVVQQQWYGGSDQQWQLVAGLWRKTRVVQDMFEQQLIA